MIWLRRCALLRRGKLGSPAKRPSAAARQKPCSLSAVRFAVSLQTKMTKRVRVSGSAGLRPAYGAAPAPGAPRGAGRGGAVRRERLYSRTPESRHISTICNVQALHKQSYLTLYIYIYPPQPATYSHFYLHPTSVTRPHIK